MWQSPNLLWRLQNGELPANLHPAVFWVLIGTNDLGVSWCAPELVLIGILRVVEELLEKRPAATIVINGIFPLAFDKRGYVNRPESRNHARRGQRLRPPVWKSVEAINDQLRRYSKKHDRVVYFETNKFFVDPDAEDNDLQLNSEFMYDSLHFNSKGYELWAKEIVKTLKPILDNR
mmetsp:Transcript_4999/g.7712  ORF Transcript_4999/g.7712 Transcript_4999/m.7712 type:complete len:176 (+) Transcript_4999:311-838(+)